MNSASNRPFGVSVGRKPDNSYSQVVARYRECFEEFHLEPPFVWTISRPIKSDNRGLTVLTFQWKRDCVTRSPRGDDVNCKFNDPITAIKVSVVKKGGGSTAGGRN